MYNNPTKGTNSEHRDVVLDILSDARVVGPLMQTGLFHADVNRRNYMYVFGHNSATGPHANVSKSIYLYCNKYYISTYPTLTYTTFYIDETAYENITENFQTAKVAF